MKKLMKSLLMSGLIIGVLSGCTSVPEGFDEDFWYDAKYVFEEIDDDTSEIENPDPDDLANLDILELHVETQKDKVVYDNLTRLAQLNEEMLGEVGEFNLNKIEINKESLREYIVVRQQIANLMELNVYDFEFQED